MIRVRFAPSPTGFPHVGNIRTAMFNWLFARRHGGKFIVRVEDTDQNRLVSGALDSILEALAWLGLQWDEGPNVGGPYGPYFQSQRLRLYASITDQLIKDEQAYYCYCTPERLTDMRKRQQTLKQPTGYDRHCLNLPTSEKENMYGAVKQKVVRFRMPNDRSIILEDLIRGKVSWDSNLLDDFVILKSDGYPTYHLASVVDDHLMEITHVLRAEEWLPSTPKHLMIYQALNWDAPLFGHMPMILGPDKSKLSKRHGATSALEYKEMGYLPDTMINFMALLGWSLDDHTEILSQETLVKEFSLDRVVKSAAIFNKEKLDWMNGLYIRSMNLDDLTVRLEDYWKEFPNQALSIPTGVSRDYLLKVVSLIQERLKLLSEAQELTEFFFLDDINLEIIELIQKGMDVDLTLFALDVTLRELGTIDSFNVQNLEKCLLDLNGQLELSRGQFLGMLRMALTGQKSSPPLFETMEVLGRDRCIKRLESARSSLS